VGAEDTKAAMSRVSPCALMLLAAMAACDRGPAARDEAAGGPVVARPPDVSAVPATDPSQLEPLELRTGRSTSRESRPLIVALHGRGGRPDGFAHVFDGFDSPARIVIPAGTYALGSGFSWVPEEVPGEAEMPYLIEGADRVASLVERLERAGAGRAIVVGFSQGGCLAYILAARHPDLLSFAVPIAADLPVEAWPPTGLGDRRGPTVRALHGASDPLAPVIAARRSVIKLRMLGYDATIRVYGGLGHSLDGRIHDDLFALIRHAVSRVPSGDPELTVCGPCPGATMDRAACALCPR
jgi:phospholipase/carboxylesterase